MSAGANHVRGSLAALLAAVAMLFAVPGIADAQPSGGGGTPVKCQTPDGMVEAGDEVTVIIRDRRGRVVYKKTSICGNDGKMHDVIAIGVPPKSRSGFVTTATVKAANR